MNLIVENEIIEAMRWNYELSMVYPWCSCTPMYLRELAIISFLICSCVPQKLFWALPTWNKIAADTFTRHVSVNGCTCFDP